MRATRRPQAVPAVIAAVLYVVLLHAADLSAQGFRRNEPPRPEFIPADYNDYQHTLTQLGITQMRRGRDGRGPDTSDEATANPWKDSMPALLVLNDGTPVTSVEQWTQRRAEILELFEREVYGRVPDNAPAVHWEVTATEEGESGGIATITRTLAGRVDNSAFDKLTVTIQASFTVPKEAAGPVPILLQFSFGFGGFGFPGRRGGTPWTQQALEHGWGHGSINPNSIQGDNNRLREGVIGLTNKGEPRRPEDWGALRAWAWGVSRLIDYFEGHPELGVDPTKVCITGVSRYGKAALVATAFEERIAAGFVASSGAGGAKLFRRDFGEMLENLASSGGYHWMAGNFLKYGAEEASFGRKTVADLPVDQHQLIALCAPRLCFISYGVPPGDPNWVDAHGSFMATVLAGSAWRLLGKQDLGTPGDYLTDAMPPVNTLIGGELAWRQHDGGHTNVPNFPAFFEWAGRYIATHSAPSSVTRAADPEPPDGFRAIFNGRDLTGWHGLNPHSAEKLTGDEKEANLAQQRAEFPQNWRVEDGELVNDGHGPYATTDEEFGDIELRLEYKTVAGADSGIYLRGTPQVQIWDWNQVFNPERPTRKPHLGSGGLFNNTPDAPGRDPHVRADRAFGEWNEFRIRQIGDRTWVWLNDQFVVDGAAMENFWDRGLPLPARGPIMLQTHGGEIRWRNIFVREFSPAEAQQALSEAEADTKTRLSRALTLHASFDRGLEADFARGDRTCYVAQGKDLVIAAPTDAVLLAPHAGRFGGALQFTKKNDFRPAYKDAGVLGYNDQSWNATVSVWLRLDPDKDLEPGYCDPVQIVGDDSKKGFIFLEWSKDETPRYFRYAIRPLFPIWNPDNVAWDQIPFEKRPMVQVERAPFSRDSWTHAVCTLENINDKTKPQRGRLYLNGRLQGVIENWDLTFGWDPARVLLVLGAAYVGHLDDLAVFDRVLTDGEVQHLYGLKEGVSELR